MAPSWRIVRPTLRIIGLTLCGRILSPDRKGDRGKSRNRQTAEFGNHDSLLLTFDSGRHGTHANEQFGLRLDDDPAKRRSEAPGPLASNPAGLELFRKPCEALDADIGCSRAGNGWLRRLPNR
jgi:hypothetical protein